MAKAKDETDPFADLDPDGLYKVLLTKPLKIGRIWVRPGDHVELKGKVILSEEVRPNVSEVLPVTG